MNLKSAIPILNGCFLTALSLLFSVHAGRAQGLVFESARLGPTNQSGGLSINSSQYFGVRFHLQQDVLITAVGGHFVNYGFLSTNAFDAFIVRLESEADLPEGSPFAPEEVLASAPCTLISDLSRDYIFPIRAQLAAGHYALIFGGGAVNAAMPGNNEQVQHSSFMVWDVEGWREYPRTFGNGKRALPNYRFTLYGIPVE